MAKGKKTIADEIIKDISIRRCIDPRVVKAVVYHPLLFAKYRMMDDDDDRPIRVKFFGVFVQKYIKTKEFYANLRHKSMIKNLVNVYGVIKDIEEYCYITSPEHLKEVLDNMLAIKDRDSIYKIFTIWSEHKNK